MTKDYTSVERLLDHELCHFSLERLKFPLLDHLYSIFQVALDKFFPLYDAKSYQITHEILEPQLLAPFGYQQNPIDLNLLSVLNNATLRYDNSHQLLK